MHLKYFRLGNERVLGRRRFAIHRMRQDVDIGCDSLGTKLKAERESRGSRLDDVSASTKIPVARWSRSNGMTSHGGPKGFTGAHSFGRTHGPGPAAEPLTDEFARLFPDEPSLEPPPAGFAAASPHANSANEPLALTFAGPGAERVPRSLSVALIEVAGVLAAGAFVGWAAGITLLTASGAVALVYYPFVRAAPGSFAARRTFGAGRRRP